MNPVLSYHVFYTAKTTEIDAIRFQDKDLVSVGTLEYGQFGVVQYCIEFAAIDCHPYAFQIDVVTCRLNGRVYVRKSIEKRFAIRTRDVRLLHHCLYFQNALIEDICV